ncbi:hypothetical protein DICPUDRAFT_78829 [Dictyostelium purpureum]|uniref:CMP/dCMP-type deaminase domain-containing protein n=1 Tax=Dictyostelium purpureum TaxID=5786 RepID=F0ZKP5_DICPU|nr:uncharacterized protein DICPUDRAFT_78829 [Dictyostelium purpureum]EGC35511.1 hypothetical protein DICPUDRAFT_78829 [Dictyostelium purpureum]|eukprot:XP_003287990.1 hypothetical protein DICPUDRAFT_78829 [Dictyostelium purpureum]
MFIKIVTFLVLVFSIISLAKAGKSECPSSPFVQVPPSDLIQPKDLSTSDLIFHENNMRIALNLAISVNGRFGAAIINRNGTLLCTAMNNGTVSKILHAEINAILNCTDIMAARGIKQSSWEGYYLYVTGEPCPMCTSALIWSKFDAVIFGTYVDTLYCGKCNSQLPITSNYINGFSYGVGSKLKIVGGILESETDKLFINACGLNNATQYIQPICNAGWSQSCPRQSRVFGDKF